MGRADKKWDRDYKVKKFEADENYRTKDLARREEDSKSNREYREKMLGLKGQELQIKKSRAANKGDGKHKTPKPQEHKDWGGDLGEYTVIVSGNMPEAAKQKARSVFIQKYGVDPEKYLR